MIYIQLFPTIKKLYLLIIIKFQFVIESDVNTYEIYILRFKKIFLDNPIAIEINFSIFLFEFEKAINQWKNINKYAYKTCIISVGEVIYFS